ncbi:MAG: hypothetical protein R3D65_00820 [Zhengella sp.]|uniref:hypothetical protein n=1 Tax=Zhengella sp. TaxID=2282762 RepID=UPI003529A1EC|nr:hypothetical protein [Brucellaceae bacterium]
MPRRPASLVSACLLPLLVSTGALARDCEADARAAMVDVRHPVAILQHVSTIMGENTMRSLALTTPDNRGMSMSEDGTPMTLWVGGRFYTTADKGKTWKLMSESSEEAQAEAMEQLRARAAAATNITCAYDTELEGRKVHHFSLDYVLENVGMEMQGEYWIDAETGFPWRIKTVSPHNTIIQDNEPAPAGMGVPDPEG